VYTKCRSSNLAEVFKSQFHTSHTTASVSIAKMPGTGIRNVFLWIVPKGTGEYTVRTLQDVRVGGVYIYHCVLMR
jgi:hypothetical protein